MKNRVRKLPVVLFTMLASALLIVACGGGGSSSGGGGSSGSSTVAGSVAQFSSGQASFFPTPQPQGSEKLIALATDLIVSRAWAAEGGVTVAVGGLSTVTGSDGAFQIDGVAAGAQDVSFSKDGVTASFSISVPENSTVVLSNVRIVGSQVSVDNLAVDSQGSPSVDNVSPDDQSSDDDSSDDASSDDVSQDDGSDDDSSDDDNKQV